MKFAIFIYGNEAAWSALSSADVDELAAAHAKITDELASRNELIGSSEVDEDNSAVIRSSRDSATVTRKPYVRDGQMVSGFYLIECTDLDRAIEVASGFAEAKFAPIEIRPLADGSTWVTLQANQ